MNVEIWRDVKGFEGLYQVSNLGNVKSLKCHIRTLVLSEVEYDINHTY